MQYSETSKLIVLSLQYQMEAMQRNAKQVEYFKGKTLLWN